MSEPQEERLEQAQRAIRSRLADATEEHAEEIIATFTEAMRATKKVQVPITCRDCGKTRTYPVDVPDAKAAAHAVDIFLTQSHGRPGVEPSPDEQRVTVRYYTVTGEGAELARQVLDATADAETVQEMRETLSTIAESLVPHRDGVTAVA